MAKTLIGGTDIETTGFLDKGDHKIIEVCVMQYEADEDDLRNSRLVKSYTQRFNPLRSVPESSVKIHHITGDMLVGMPTFKEEGQKYLDILGECDIVVGHNGDEFDLPFIAHEAKSCGLIMPPIASYDTMLQGQWAHPYGKRPKLQELCIACGVEYDTTQAHAADYDVEVMMKCFFEMGYRQSILMDSAA